MQKNLDKILSPAEIKDLNDDETEYVIKNDKMCKGDYAKFKRKYKILKPIGSGGFG
jgi:hypothetical protein